MLRDRIPFRAKYFAKQLSQRTVGRVADIFLPPVQKFVILTNGRTGSNLLVSYLQAHPRFTVYGEVIGSYYMHQDFMRKKLVEHDSEYLDIFLRRTALELHVGVKLLYRQIEKKYAADARNALLADKSIKILHLRRENLFDVVLSHALAKNLRAFVGRDYGDATTELCPEDCHRSFQQIEAWERAYRALFSDHDYLELCYERLAEAPEATLADVYGFLGAEPVSTRSPLARQRRQPREKVVRNYAELKQAFAGTPYDRFFA